MLAVASSTGTNASIAQASSSAAGVMSTAHHDKLDGIESGATADQTASDIKTLFNSSGLVNAQIDASAAIAGTKIDPNFGTQDVTGRYFYANDIFLGDVSPELRFTDSDNNPDYRIRLNSGILDFFDLTNSTTRMSIQADGHIDIAGNLDVGAGIDVTGNITVSGTVDGIDIATDVAANTAKVTNATHTGEVTGATALTIADNVVDEANLKISNSPVNGYMLTAQSGNTGGLTWAPAAAGATGASNDEIFWENGTNVTADYTITNGKNAGSFGPITINSGVTVTIGAGETWTVV